MSLQRKQRNKLLFSTFYGSCRDSKKQGKSFRKYKRMERVFIQYIYIVQW